MTCCKIQNVYSSCKSLYPNYWINNKNNSSMSPSVNNKYWIHSVVIASLSYQCTLVSTGATLKTQQHAFLWPISDETQKLLKELSNRKQLQVPNIYHHMPHLLNNEGSLHPAVQVGLGRTGGEKLIHTQQGPWFMRGLLSRICMLFLHKHTQTPTDPYYTRMRIKSQQVVPLDWGFQ